MDKEIVGSFVFRNEGDGCLTSKFLANTDDTPHTEACKRKTELIPDTPFVGTYTTVWVQPGGSTGKATLEIQKAGDIYNLEWRNTPLKYLGKAMMFEGKLVGSYWSIEK